ncbi:hypothetical protein IWQ62_005737, partial [Dispira parvispora]
DRGRIRGLLRLVTLLERAFFDPEEPLGIERLPSGLECTESDPVDRLLFVLPLRPAGYLSVVLDVGDAVEHALPSRPMRFWLELNPAERTGHDPANTHGDWVRSCDSNTDNSVGSIGKLKTTPGE